LIDNALILFETQKVSVLIDPQRQALNWLKNEIPLATFIDSDNTQNLNFFGTVVISGQITDDLTPVIEMDRTKNNVKFMGKECIVKKDFKLIILLTEIHPTFTDHIYRHAIILNFTLTQSAMQYHLLNMLHLLEHPASCNQHIWAMK
jgi:hypothetical protein